ncbi:hypothetical protein H3C61_01800 [Candidatus Gracilibacteria bacterium]|nr:hypothetical protein [Candidatus Gracilibacteria bacterium]
MPIEILNGSSDSSEKKDDLNDLKSDTKDSVLNIINKTNFISFLEDGIYLDISRIKSRDDFISFVGDFFGRGFYFKDLDYKLFSDIIFDIEKIEGNNIKLASSIEKIDEKKAQKYQKPFIYNGLQSEYIFSKIYSDIEEDGKTKEIEVFLDIDEFIAQMWNYGIRFGLKIDDIKKEIKLPTNKKILIADYIEPTLPIDESLQSMQFFGQDLSLDKDYKNYKRSYITFPKLSKLYKIEPAIYGKNGLNILGEYIKPTKEPKKIDLNKIIGEGVELLEQDGNIYIISSIDGFVSPPQGNYNSKNTIEKDKKFITLNIDEILNPIKVTEHIEFGEIGPKTGNIITEYSVLIKGLKSEYIVRAKNISSYGENCGSMSSYNDINIDGNVIGKMERQENIFSMTEDGQIISLNGNIKVNGKVLFNNVLSAVKGRIDLYSIENSIIFGKDIEIVNARRCFIFGENIKITGQLIDSIVISTQTIDIASTSHKDRENCIYFLRGENYENKIKEINNIISDLLEKLAENKLNIQEIIKENELLMKDENNFKVLSIIKKKKSNLDISQDENNFLRNNYQLFLDAFDLIKNNKIKLESLNQSQELIIKKIEELKINLVKYNDLISNNQNKSKKSLKIKINQSNFKLKYLILPGFVDFSGLNMEELKSLNIFKDNLDIFLPDNIEKHFASEDILDIKTGTIDWEEDL